MTINKFGRNEYNTDTNDGHNSIGLTLLPLHPRLSKHSYCKPYLLNLHVQCTDNRTSSGVHDFRTALDQLYLASFANTRYVAELSTV